MTNLDTLKQEAREEFSKIDYWDSDASYAFVEKLIKRTVDEVEKAVAIQTHDCARGKGGSCSDASARERCAEEQKEAFTRFRNQKEQACIECGESVSVNEPVRNCHGNCRIEV